MATFQFSTVASNLADGTLITTTNVPPISTVTMSATPTTPPQVSALHPVLGRQAFLAGGNVSTGTAYCRAAVSGSPTSLAIRWGFKMPSLPGAAADWFDIRNVTSNAKVCGLGLSSTNQLQVKNAAGTVPTNGTYTTALVNTKVYVLQLQVVVGSTTSNGTINVQLFDTDGTTQLFSFAGSANQNTGTTGISQIWLPGKQTNNTTGGAFLVAYNWPRWETGQSTAVGNIPRNLSVSAGVDQVAEPWSTVTLAASTAADLGATSTWSQVGGVPVTLSSTTANSPTFTAPAHLTQQQLTFRRSATDFNQPTASTATDDVMVTVRPATESVWVDGTEKPARFDILV